MDIVAALPPPNAQAAAEIADEDANQCVDNKVVRDATVTCIVRAEHDLLPEQSEEGRGRAIPSGAQEVHEAGEQRTVPEHFDAIAAVVAVVEALALDSLMQLLVLYGDGALGSSIERWVCLNTRIDVVLDGLRKVLVRGEDLLRGQQYGREGLLGPWRCRYFECAALDRLLGFGVEDLVRHLGLGIVVMLT